VACPVRAVWLTGLILARLAGRRYHDNRDLGVVIALQGAE